MIFIGSDHTGVELKKNIINYFYENHIEYADVTNFENQEGDDYPDIACMISSKVLEGQNHLGIAICGTGIGISIACNKIKGIRAALCFDTYMAEMSRKHNNANILCLGARTSNAQKFENVKNIVDVFINSFYDGGRHDIRLEKIKQIENSKIEGGK